MADSDIPNSVKTFIADHIDSPVHLEILLLLYHNPKREFTAADVARELRIEPSGAAPRLAALRARGMLVSNPAPDPHYRYEPNSPALRQTIEQVARVYASHRVSLTAHIFAKPPEALRNFADAFRIRKDKADG